jgi:REP element-mobilizing transposase RayT
VRGMEKYIQIKNKGLQPLVLSDRDEIEITKYVFQIAGEDNMKILAYNICRDHVHLILKCEVRDRDNLVRKLKGKSAQLYKTNHHFTGEFHLWAQKYSWLCITNDEQLSNLYEYVTYNRTKHNLTENNELELLIKKMLTPYEELFNEN